MGMDREKKSSMYEYDRSTLCMFPDFWVYKASHRRSNFHLADTRGTCMTWEAFMGREWTAELTRFAGDSILLIPRRRWLAGWTTPLLGHPDRHLYLQQISGVRWRLHAQATCIGGTNLNHRHHGLARRMGAGHMGLGMNGWQRC